MFVYCRPSPLALLESKADQCHLKAIAESQCSPTIQQRCCRSCPRWPPKWTGTCVLERGVVNRCYDAGANFTFDNALILEPRVSLLTTRAFTKPQLQLASNTHQNTRTRRCLPRSESKANSTTRHTCHVRHKRGPRRLQTLALHVTRKMRCNLHLQHASQLCRKILVPPSSKLRANSALPYQNVEK